GDGADREREQQAHGRRSPDERREPRSVRKRDRGAVHRSSTRVRSESISPLSGSGRDHASRRVSPLSSWSPSSRATRSRARRLGAPSPPAEARRNNSSAR